MARFADALDRNMEEIKRPDPIPVGHYIARVAKMPGMPEEVKGKPYEIMRIDCQVVSPGDDVDPDDLQSFGNVVGAPFRIDFIFNTDPEEKMKFEGTLNRLKSFIKNCGVDADSGSLKERLAEIVGGQFMVEIKHRLDPNDSEAVYLDVGRTAAID